jgi:pilus assembly protein CpaE
MNTKILVVDDDVDSLKLIGLMLQRQGYEVVAANSGGSAIERATVEHPDLVILDIMMPDMDGYQVCRALRADERTREIPIIMFTAKTLVDDKVAGFEAGADDYLTKPTHPAELASRVKTVLARSAARQRGSGSPGTTYAFVGSKGGVGTSTLAVNAGAIMSTRDTAVLVDFRLGQGTNGLSLGFPESSGLANLLRRPAVEINPRTVDSELVTHNCGLRLLTSSMRPRENQLKVPQEMAESVVKALKSLAQSVLIDLGAGLNRLSAHLLREVDHVVVTVEPNNVSLAMGRELVQEIRQIGGTGRTSVVIISRTTSTLSVPWQEAEKMLEHEILGIISPVPELAFQAAQGGVPLVVMQPEATVTSQYAKMVEELLKRARVEAD